MKQEWIEAAKDRADIECAPEESAEPIVRAFLAAAEADGFVMVPKESTGNMNCAGGDAQTRSIGSWGEPSVVWSAMIAARDGAKMAPGRDDSSPKPNGEIE